MAVCFGRLAFDTSMSSITPSVGNASGAVAHVPIERRLAELGDRHRAALSQARVLNEVAVIAQASAVMGPGYIIPESEAGAILTEATIPLTPIQAAIHANQQDPSYAVNLEYAIASFACRCAGKAKSELADHFDWQVQQRFAGTDLAGMAKQHISMIESAVQISEQIDSSVQSLLYSGGDTATSRLNLNRYKARTFQIEAVDFNQTVLVDYNRYTTLYDKLSREVKGLTKTTDLDQWRIQEGDTSNFSREQKNITDHTKPDSWF